MALSRRTKLLLLLVVAALAIFLYDLSKQRSLPKRPRVLTSVVQALSSTPLENSDTTSLISSERWKNIQERTALNWGRDPFLLDPAKVKAASKDGLGSMLKVTGIVWDSRHHYAVINDFVVREGDEVNGAKVLKIRRDRVVLQKGGKEYMLRLGE